MRKVTVRDLRNHAGRVLERVAKGESVTVTMDGQPVAELRPIRSALSAAALVARWRNLPRVDARRLRADLDSVIDSRL